MAGEAKTKRPRKAAADPPDPNDPPDPDDPNDPPDPDPDEESIEEVVKRVLAEELPKILGEVDDPDDPPDPDDPDKDPPKSRRSAADDERVAYKAIRAAMDRLNREDHTEARLKQLEEKVTEEAPAQVRRATRLMWGNPERERAKK